MGNKPFLAVVAVLIALGGALILTGYNATGEQVPIFGIEFETRFVMLFGGMAILAAMVLGFEKFGKAKRRHRVAAE